MPRASESSLRVVDAGKSIDGVGGANKSDKSDERPTAIDLNELSIERHRSSDAAGIARISGWSVAGPNCDTRTGNGDANAASPAIRLSQRRWK